MAQFLLTLLHALGVCVLVQLSIGYSAPYDRNTLRHHKVIPDVIDKEPDNAVKVEYSDTAKVEFGSPLSQSDINMAPKVIDWPAEEDALYTLIMTDPDVPCRKYPTQREWVHWLIANIPGNNWMKGKFVCNYVQPRRAVDGTRYVFLVYKQPDKKPVEYKEMQLEGSLHRLNFSAREFAKKHSLGDPVAVNFFEIPFDPAQKEKEREMRKWVKQNRKYPPTLTTRATTKSYRELNPFNWQ